MGRLPLDVVADQLEAWRTLRCWPRVPYTVAHRSGYGSTGAVYYRMGEHPDFIEVHAGRDAADAYATILHELAHVYHGRKHGRAWRLGYLAAVAEVCGVDADEVIADMRGRPSQRKADLVARRWMARQMAQGILYGGSQ